MVAVWMLLSGSTAKATVLNGTFTYPDGSVVNGTLTLRLERSGLRNTCVTPSVTASTAPVVLTVANGVLQGAPNIVPTDCLTAFQPYAVVLKDAKHATLFSEHWYVTSVYGGLLNVNGGTQWGAPTGLPVTAATGLPVAYTLATPMGNTKVATQAVTLAGSATTTVTVTWPTKFAALTYLVVCATLDTTAPTTPPGLYVSRMVTQSATAVTVVVQNGAVGSHTGTVVCHAHQDANLTLASFALTLKDSSNGLWLVQAVRGNGQAQDTNGTLTPTVPVVNDAAQTASWQLGVATTGLVTTTAVTYGAGYPTAVLLLSADGTFLYNLGATTAGLLQD